MIALQMSVHQTPVWSGLHGDQVLGLNGVRSIYSSWLGAILAARLTIVCDALKNSEGVIVAQGHSRFTVCQANIG